MDPVSAVLIVLTIIGWSVGLAFTARGYELFVPPIFRRYVLGQNIENLRKDLLDLELNGNAKDEHKATEILNKYPSELFERQQNFSDGLAMKAKYLNKNIVQTTRNAGYYQLFLESGLNELELGQFSYALFKNAKNLNEFNEAFKSIEGFKPIVVAPYSKEQAILNAKSLKALAEQERYLSSLKTISFTKEEELKNIRTQLASFVKEMPANRNVKQELIQKLANEGFFDNLGGLPRNKMDKYAAKLGLAAEFTKKAHNKNGKLIDKVIPETSITYLDKNGKEVTLSHYFFYYKTKDYTLSESIWNGVKRVYKVTNSVVDIFTCKAVRSALTIFGAVFTIVLIATGSMIVPLPALAIALAVVTLVGLGLNLAFRTGWNYYKMHVKQKISEELILQEEMLLNIKKLKESGKDIPEDMMKGDRQNLHNNGLVSPLARAFAALSGYIVEDIFGDLGVNSAKNTMSGNFLGPVSDATFAGLPVYISAPLNFLGRFGYFIGTFITVSIYALWGEEVRVGSAKQGDLEKATTGKMQLRADEIPPYKNLDELRVNAKKLREYVRHEVEGDVAYTANYKTRSVSELLAKSTIEMFVELTYENVAGAYSTITGASNKENPLKTKLNNKELDRGAKHALKATTVDKDGELVFNPDSSLKHPRPIYELSDKDTQLGS